MSPNVPMFLDARAKALASGDRGLLAAIDADLARYGYTFPTVNEVVRVEKPTGEETTAVKAPETAVRSGGRPRLPRCEHNRTPGNCRKCPTH